MKSNSVTLTEIAVATGYSVGTVSKALNGRGQLSAKTRRAVAEAAKELGFESSRFAHASADDDTYTIGVLSTDSYGRFTIPILTGAEDSLGAGKMAMLLCESRGDPIREKHYIQVLLQRRVDGIIVTGHSSEPRSSITADVPVPVVYALCPSIDPHDVSVVPDDEAGAARAVEHLLATGKRSIAVVGGPRNQEPNRHRVSGALRALSEGGGELVGGVPLYGEWTERWGYEAVSRLFRDRSEFDGVFCTNDQIARGAIERLREEGRSIPADVGVVGVDNWDVMVEAARPSITSIDLNLREVGRVAANILLEKIEHGSEQAGRQLVQCTLVTRESS